MVVRNVAVCYRSFDISEGQARGDTSHFHFAFFGDSQVEI